MSNLTKRALSGIIYVTIFTFCILYSRTTFCLLFVIVTSLSLDEFNKLLEEHQLAQVNRTVSMISGVYLFLAFFLFTTGTVSFIIFMPYLLSIIFTLISELYLKRPQPIANWAYSFAGQLYIALPFALLNLLAFNSNSGYSALLPICVFIFLWLSDSGAYIFGSFLKKKIPYRLFPRISPHKTWIGSIGGGFVVLLTATIMFYLSHTATLLLWLGLGLTVVVFGTFGDLTESLLKRQLNLKDSGKFMPGHGGVLDRFDSVLMAIPAAVIYIYCFHFPL